MRRTRALMAFATLSLMAAAASPLSGLHAQADGTTMSALATRQELERFAAESEARAASASGDEKARLTRAAEMARTRLRDGDFLPGERLVVKLDSLGTTTTDTAIVREDRTISLRQLPQIPMQGVLHSEAQAYLVKQYARYIRDPQLTVVPTVRLAIFGPVASPGFYNFPYDMLLSDAIMAAGGPAQGADVNKATVQRGKRKVLEERDVTLALMRGMTLDQLGLRAGDNVVIPGATKKSWVEVLRAVGVGLGIVITLYTIGRRL